MAQVNKNTLKEYFQTGSIPNQQDFGDLIDSLVNIQDDSSTVKAMYESNSNTNNFTDAEKSSLSDLNSGATLVNDDTKFATQKQAKDAINELDSDLQNQINAFSNGEGKTYTSLSDAMAVSPTPSNNTPFQVDGDSISENDGKYIYDSSESGGYLRLGDVIKTSDDFDPDSGVYVPKMSQVRDYSSKITVLETIEESELIGVGCVINSVTDGTINVTRDSGRTYPFFYSETNRYSFILSATNKYVVIARDANSALTVTLDQSGSSCMVYRWTTGDVFSLYNATFTNNLIDYGSRIVVTRTTNTITITANGSMVFEWDYSADTAPEFDEPSALGNIVPNTSAGTDLVTEARINNRVYATDYIDSKITTASTVAPESVLPLLVNQPFSSVGDSIFDVDTAQNTIQSYYGLGTHQSLAVSGQTFINQGTTPITTQIRSVSGSPKLLLIQGGTNDFGKNLTLGDANSTLTSTFYGAVADVLDYAIANHSSAYIFVIGITYRNWLGGGQVAGMVNTNGNSLMDFNAALKYHSELRGIPFVDMLAGWNTYYFNLSTKSSDNLHPNSVGYVDYSRAIIDKINEALS